MLLVAESGSTKTEWWIDGISFSGGGLNPMTKDESEILHELRLIKEQLDKENLGVTRVRFYGAGCSSEYFRNIMQKLIKSVMTKVEDVIIGHDLDAAAFALFPESNGIACILGTGSNCAFVKEGEIKKSIRALGYILGDEGSASHIGRIFLRKYFYHELEESVVHEFEKKLSMSKYDIMERIYKKPNANVFLAQIGGQVAQIHNSQSVSEIIEKCLEDFFKHRLLKLKKYSSKIGFVGSVAYYHEKILHALAEEYGFEIIKIIKNPAQELYNYWNNENN